jgi:hypothetical protein
MAVRLVDVDDSYVGKAPRSKAELFLYCAKILEVVFPHPSRCPDHSSPLDAIWDAYSEASPFSIWYAMRGSGKTFDVGILAWLESLFKPKCGTTILGGSLEQSIKAVTYLSDFWGLDKVSGLRSKLLVNNSVAGRGFKLSNGSWVQALAASSKSVRGPHPQKLRLDEVDEMERRIYEASLGQPKTKFGIADNVVISSTLHNAFGLMSEIVDSRESFGAILYKWCVEEVRELEFSDDEKEILRLVLSEKEIVEAKCCGFWSNEEIARKMRQLTKAMWDSEYLLKRPKVGDTIFDFESVERAYRRGMHDSFERSLYTEAGIDWGYAFTALSILQDDKEMIRNTDTYKFEYIELTERCNMIADIFIEKKVKRVYCDSNPKDSNVTLRKILEKKRTGTELVPIAFNKWKSLAINVLRFLLEKNKMNISDELSQKKLKAYHYKNPETSEIAKEDDHIPDSLIAWAASRYNLIIH